MPDYEIRYFHADGSLAIVHISAHASHEDARAHAKSNLGDHAHFEVRDGSGAPLSD
ncbi:MAG TPA: hypothetical protein VHU87_11555 [Rhizomicrobium sp.]|jgi:hypothetical protein|nr:hypothetical protein [Rhizomicrobium sp.]